MKRSEKYKMFLELKKNEATTSVNTFIPYNLIWKKDTDNYGYHVIDFITDIAPPMSYQDCGIPKDVFFALIEQYGSQLKKDLKQALDLVDQREKLEKLYKL